MRFASNAVALRIRHAGDGNLGIREVFDDANKLFSAAFISS
jgi:hypothetical protein